MSLRRASNGAAITLSDELGRGGEGIVYLIDDTPDLVAKIYFEPPEANKVAKLSAMVRLAPPELLRIAAWPTELLVDENAAVRGFIMQRVSSREDAHELYSPKSRRRAFPDADFRFIVHAAANVARTFAQLHSLGHVIGDVNHGNALIGRDATVVLIDCDSFQVKDAETRFTCDVGVPLFTPPELQGENFRGLMRSADHDAFGLAVLLFHFLYVGRHPFAGLYAGDEMPIERAIAESRFAFGATAISLGVSAPPGTLALDAFGPAIAALFERAFSAPGVASRPTAVEWVSAMDALEADLTTCSQSPAHHHPKGAACCWCELENRTSILLFGWGGRRAIQGIERAEIERFWEKIEAEPATSYLGCELVRYAYSLVTQLVAKRKDERGNVWLGFIGLVILSSAVFPRNWGTAWLVLVLVGAILVYANQLFREHPGQGMRERMLRVVESRFSRARFESAFVELANSRQRLLKILEDPRLHVSEAIKAHRALEQEQYRHTTLLKSANGPALTERERGALLILGVETAADVLRLRSQLHHALSYAKVREIIDWAENCGADLEVREDVSLDPHEVRRFDEALRGEAKRLMQELRGGATRLRTLREDILRQRGGVARDLDYSE